MRRTKVIGTDVEITPATSLACPELAEDLDERRRVGVEAAAYLIAFGGELGDGVLPLLEVARAACGEGGLFRPTAPDRVAALRRHLEEAVEPAAGVELAVEEPEPIVH